MRERKRSGRPGAVLLGIALTVIAIRIFTGPIPGTGRGISVGLVESKGTGGWSAHYASFTGTRTGALRGDGAPLHIAVETKEGSLTIVVEDTEETVLFSQTATESASFSVDVPREVRVSVTGEGHKGGFELDY